MLPAKCKLASL